MFILVRFKKHLLLISKRTGSRSIFPMIFHKVVLVPTVPLKSQTIETKQADQISLNEPKALPAT